MLDLYVVKLKNHTVLILLMYDLITIKKYPVHECSSLLRAPVPITVFILVLSLVIAHYRFSVSPLMPELQAAKKI